MKTYDINAVEEQLKTQDSEAYLTSGVSMRPLLRTHKDIVVISKAKHPLSVGDVPLYKKKGVEKLILHRIIGIKEDGTYIIRGDNTYHKEYIPQSDVVGVMTALYRGGKYIDCNNSKPYEIYVRLNKFFYPA
ncbi:MAG: S24/S26 family peptidase, partial [Clostridia bacterium]|nr:S24/S26 family peptidase [Clostridia bacterium]